MTACVTGCTSLGRHMSHCDDEDCRGCMPRETELGNVCGRCWSNLQRDVRTAPSIVDWIREHVEPSSQWGERVNSKEIDAPAPLGINAVDDADELHAILAAWALLILEENPNVDNGPNLVDNRLGHPTMRTYSWLDEDGIERVATHHRNREIIGAHTTQATTDLCKWLTIHLEWAAGQVWAGEMVREIGRHVRTFLARYPDAEKSRPLVAGEDGVGDPRCPVCERTSMVYTPPAWAGQPILIQCDHNDCGCIIPEDRYGLFMAMVAEDRKRELEESA